MGAGRESPVGLRQPAVDQGSAREVIVRDIIRGLYEGRYVPGQRLIEAQLTARSGASRGPVREALNRLAATGVVELTLQRGACVRKLTVEEAIDILVVVEGLVGIAARLAAQRIGRPGARETIEAARDRILTIDRSTGTADYATARDTFYAAITRTAGNDQLSRLLQIVQIHLIRVQFRSAMRSAERRRDGDYQRIADEIIQGRPAAAESAARAHIRRSIAALSQCRDQSAGTAKVSVRPSRRTRSGNGSSDGSE